MGVLAGRAIRIEGRLPGSRRQAADRVAVAFVEVEPDRVVHRATGSGVQRGEVIHDLVAGSGAVDGDQQIPPVGGGDLGDRGVQDRDVVGAGIGSGVALAEHHHEELTGVVAGGQERVVAVGPLPGATGPGLVAVGDHDRGVQPDHDGLAEVAVTRSGGGDLPVPGHDLAPHPGPGRGPGPVASGPAGRRRSRPGSATPWSSTRRARTSRPGGAVPSGHRSRWRRRRPPRPGRPGAGPGRCPG